MADMKSIIIGIIILAAGTYMMRAFASLVGNKKQLSQGTKVFLSDAAIVLLFSVALTATFYSGTDFAGFAKIAGVAVAAVMAWKKVPFIILVFSAALITALFRYCGIS